MSDETDDLNAAVSELDDGYLKVLLLLAVRRATTEEPRRAGLWHSLAGILSAEQEKRQDVADFLLVDAAGVQAGEVDDLSTVLAELRRDLDVLEAEYKESTAQPPQQ